MPLPPHIRAGKAAERYARRWLEQQGLQHLLANYCCKAGELDLVMRDHTVLVVVEVRYRAHTRFGGALASISPQKQQRIARATQHLLRTNTDWSRLALRFDVVALTGAPPHTRVDWRKRAFYAEA